MKIIETVFVVILFFLYFALWKIKRLNQIKSTGKDPEVMRESESNVQRFMNQLFKTLTAYASIIIIIHSTGFQFASLFSRFEKLNNVYYDIVGFLLGLFGLSLCAYAQIKMGKSWRVGIDEKEKTDLITTGLYRYIRNPTYLGLFILNLGVWLIWSTWTIFILNLMFVIILEIQVRCEEDFLISVHGDKYRDYKRRTKRYVPFIY